MIKCAMRLCVVTAGVTFLLLSGCDRPRNEGPAEEIGREIDDAVSDAEEEKGVGDKIGEELQELGDDIEDRS